MRDHTRCSAATHHTLDGFLDGCRSPRARQANDAANATRTPAPVTMMVPAAPTHLLLMTLRAAGFTAGELAAIVGVSVVRLEAIGRASHVEHRVVARLTSAVSEQLAEARTARQASRETVSAAVRERFGEVPRGESRRQPRPVQAALI